MLRLAALLALAASLAVAFLVPGSASADVNSCPPVFTLISYSVPPGADFFVADRNQDYFFCVGRGAQIDNDVPSHLAPGVTDSGVLVDTSTGEVLGG